MVFCYKIITDPPAWSGQSSPRKGSPCGRLPYLDSSISQLINTVDYDAFESSNLLDVVPEREWRLLASLYRKREASEERQKLAREFNRMWEQERQENKCMADEMSEQYKRYIYEKRKQERQMLERKERERKNEQQIRCGRLLDYIRHKDMESANRIAQVQDQKLNQQRNKTIEKEARILLATNRRLNQNAVDDWKRRMDFHLDQQRVHDAIKKKHAFIRESAQRTAISNALSVWEATLLREEMLALEEAKRAHTASRVAYTDLKCLKIAKAKEMQKRRARRVAMLTQQLRDVVRNM